MLHPLLKPTTKLASLCTNTNREVSSLFVNHLIHKLSTAVQIRRGRDCTQDTAAVVVSNVPIITQIGILLPFCCKFFHQSANSLNL